MGLENQKNKTGRRKLVEEAAERLAEILIMQVELSRLNPKKNNKILSQKHDNR